MKRFWLLIKWFLLIILWAVFPPAFFFISKDYGIKKWARWTFTILSPWGIFAILFIILLVWEYTRPNSLEFEEVKFNTPDKVIAELGIKDLPKFSYVGNTVGADFNWDFWDCLVEFQFGDTLSIQDKENIIKQVAQKDTIHWEYRDILKEGVAEFYNIKYSDNDTIPYNMIITNDKIYVAYNNNIYYHSMSNELFNPTDYHLLMARNFQIGIDSSHKWVIQFNKSYSQYLDRLKECDEWKCKETTSSIYFTRETSQDSYRIQINKKRNIAIVEYDTY